MTLDHLVCLEREGAALVSAARRGLDPQVAGCPGWDVAALVGHVGQVHHWVLENVRTQSLTRVPESRVPAPPGNDQLVDWYADALAQLLAELRTVDRERQAWNWTRAPQRAGWWPRRQGHEVAVHRWDAERAHGVESAIAGDLARDGVAEVIESFLPYWTDARRGVDATVHLVDAETGHTWRLRVDDGTVAEGDEGEPDAAATGSASDLLLAMWGRIPWARLHVDGDPALLRAVQVTA